jgi:glucuronate isomerase
VARRVDCRFLAELVLDHRLELDEAHEIAVDITDGRSRAVFGLEPRP